MQKSRQLREPLLIRPRDPCGSLRSPVSGGVQESPPLFRDLRAAAPGPDGNKPFFPWELALVKEPGS